MKRLPTLLAGLVLAFSSLASHAQRADDPLSGQAPAAAQERARRPAAAGTLLEARQAARAGDVARARALVDDILQRQPNNARAHLFKANIAVREKDLETARSSLATAERLAPGLPFAREQSVTVLRNRIARLAAGEDRPGRQRAGRNTPQPAPAGAGDPPRPAEIPAPSTTPATATANTGTPAAPETRPAGEETRSGSAPKAEQTAGGSSPLMLGLLVAAVIAIAAVLLLRRRRSPPPAP
jgi:hypothetical protein